MVVFTYAFQNVLQKQLTDLRPLEFAKCNKYKSKTEEEKKQLKSTFKVQK